MIKGLGRVIVDFPVIVSGVAFSIAVAVALIAIGQDSAISLLCALGVSVLTLQVEALYRSQKYRDEILELMEFDSAVLSAPELFDCVKQLVRNHQKIEKLEDRFFLQAANKELANTRNVMSGLAKGRLVAEYEQRRVMYGARAQETVRMVHCLNRYNYWRTSYGKRVLKSNRVAIRRKVKFTHIWIDSREGILEHRDVLEELQAAGIEIRVALIDEIPSGLIEAYRIIDENKVVRLEISPDGKSRAQHVIIDKEEVENAIDSWRRLRDYTENLSEFLAGSVPASEKEKPVGDREHKPSADG